MPASARHTLTPSRCRLPADAAADLRDHDVNAVTVLHVELVRRLVLTDPVAIEEEADRLDGHALALAEGAHQLLELGVRLALEEDLRAVLADDLELHGGYYIEVQPVS